MKTLYQSLFLKGVTVWMECHICYLLYVEREILLLSQDVYGRGVMEGEIHLPSVRTRSRETSIHPGDERFYTHIRLSLVGHHPQHQG